jgi:hypothetical protein
VARRLKENEGQWASLEYPRSSWLQTQLQSGAQEVNTATAKCLKERALALENESEDAEGGGYLMAPSCFSERGDMRVLSLEDRMNSIYLAVAGYADNSHMRTAPDADVTGPLPASSGSDSVLSSLSLSPLSLPPSSPWVPPATVQEQKRALEHEFYRLCSNVICVDRNEFAVERAGYSTRICTMSGLFSSAKTDMLIGWLPAA